MIDNRQPSQQMILGIHWPEEITFDNYVSGANCSAIHALQQAIVDGAHEHCFYLFGETCVGRTHLLQACCQKATDLQQTCAYLPLQQYREWQPSIFDNLETIEVLALDDIEAIAGQPLWEEALFHLINRVRQQKSKLIISGNQAPQKLTTMLPDLRSRLQQMLTFLIKPLDDNGKRMVLQQHAHARGFLLSDSVINYLLRHEARDLRHLFTRLKQLDHASLVAKRRITVPFIKNLFNLN